jgi:hypothetical protein
MSKDQPKRRMVGPWRNLHGAIWLIGLAILAWQDWWWPGILVLIAISLILEAVLMKVAPHAFETVQPSLAAVSPGVSGPIVEAPAPPATPLALEKLEPPPPPAPLVVEHRLELLPAACPRCGGEIRGREVQWTGPQSADCPYCGAILPMRAV